MGNRHGNCEPIRRFGPRHYVRLVVLLIGLAAGIGLAWQIAPFGDLWATEVVLAQGAFGGAIVGVVLASQVPVDRPAAATYRPSRDSGAG